VGEASRACPASGTAACGPRRQRQRRGRRGQRVSWPHRRHRARTASNCLLERSAGQPASKQLLGSGVPPCAFGAATPCAWRAAMHLLGQDMDAQPPPPGSLAGLAGVHLEDAADVIAGRLERQTARGGGELSGGCWAQAPRRGRSPAMAIGVPGWETVWARSRRVTVVTDAWRSHRLAAVPAERPSRTELRWQIPRPAQPRLCVECGLIYRAGRRDPAYGCVPWETRDSFPLPDAQSRMRDPAFVMPSISGPFSSAAG